MNNKKHFSVLKRISQIVFFMTVFFLFLNSSYARVYTGLEVMLKSRQALKILRGKRVGLLTNPTGVSRKLNSTVDILKYHPKINLVALFAPEHGIRGDLRAGEHVAGGKDSLTGLPVYSLYGGIDHKPKQKDLAKIDILIYDIQDVGSRAYTYIWHLAEAMSACQSAGVRVIVLDRPSPLGAMVVDGPVTKKEYLSFIGLYPIPRVYGMTVGELALFLKNEFDIDCHLFVIKMKNYRRAMSWKNTGLPWVPTSPHVPSPESACCFAATGTIGEIGTLNIGIGYTLPFQTVAAPWMNAEKSAVILNKLKLPGIRFRPIHYKPYYGAYKGQNIHGIQLHITDPSEFKPTTTEVAILCHLKKYYSRSFRWPPEKYKSFDKAMGTSAVRRAILKGYNYKSISAMWRKNIQRFKQKRKKYLLYK